MSNRLINLMWGIIGLIALVAGLAYIGNGSSAQTVECTAARAAAGKCQLSAASATTPPSVAPVTTAATSVPSTQASTTAAPTTTNATTCPGDHEMKANEVFQAAAGCNTKGDVNVSNSQNGPWTRLFDDDPNTGTLLTCNVNCWIQAPFGANVSPRTVDDLLSEMKTSGCVSGCKSVNHVVWPSGSTTSASTSAPTSSVTTTTSAVECDPSIPKGGKLFVHAGCVVTGDVAVGPTQNGPWTVLYDSDQSTGLVVDVRQDVWVFAPFGASANGGSVQDNSDAVKAVGCGLPHGCPRVIIVTWPR